MMEGFIYFVLGRSGMEDPCGLAQVAALQLPVLFAVVFQVLHPL